MSENTSVTTKPDLSPVMTRRQFLKVAAGAVVGGVAGGCADVPAAGVIPRTEIETETETEKGGKTLWQMIEDGQNKRFPNGMDVFGDLYPGIDFNFDNQIVKDIRKIPNKRQRIMEMIGFLGVKRNLRYNRVDENGDPLYVCHIYALDLALFAIGDKCIGSSHTKDLNQTPVICDIDDIDRSDPAAIPNFEATHEYFSADNLDKWMRDYGKKKHGWQQVETQEELYTKLAGGGIVIGVTKDELTKGRSSDPSHTFVLATAANGNIYLTQASDNITLEPIPVGSTNPKAYPENSSFNFWYHDLTEF